MGNYRFRFSHMLPNAWFYKLRDMTKKTRTKKPSPPTNSQITKTLPPRNSFRRRQTRQNQPVVSSKVTSAGCGCRATLVDSPTDVIRRLPPIITKANEDRESMPSSTPVNRLSSPGVRLRTRVEVGRRKRGRRTEMVVKKTEDPGREFRESMVEMIVENDIRAGKDMENLLECYLMLNSDEYHQLIVDVFKQIWLDAAAVTIAAS